jgi:carbon-monoxide dehydrogenase large subunit
VTIEAVIPSFIGAPVQRREDPALVTGTARYVDDLAPTGTLYLALVRSPFAHADVTGIDISAAEEAPGVWAIITPEEVADVSMSPTPRPDRNVPRRYPLVQGRALMPGDPVVAVVADSAATARDAADLVFVDYEPLDVVGDVEEALEASAIHQGLGSDSNVAYDRSRGDRASFDAVDGPVKLSGIVDHPRVAPAPMENRVILAEWKEGGLIVHMSSQAPQLMQERLASDLGLTQSSVRVITPFVGGAFGCKFDLAEEEYLTIIAARMTGRPVKWAETRREHLLTIGHGRAQRHRYEVVADDDGKIKALWLDSLIDLGCRHRYLSFMELCHPGLRLANARRLDQSGAERDLSRGRTSRGHVDDREGHRRRRRRHRHRPGGGPSPQFHPTRPVPLCVVRGQGARRLHIRHR